MNDETRKIISRTIAIEKGYTTNPKDAGNWTGGSVGVGDLKGTKYGISAKSYPSVDIKNLTLDAAVEIYERDFYAPLHLDLLTSTRIRWKVFDIAVNCGPRTAVKMLQRAAGVEPADGVIGHDTAAAVNLFEPSAAVKAIAAEQKQHYIDIVAKDTSQAVFLNGWIKRAEDTGDDL